jgi:hypothetical protein
MVQNAGAEVVENGMANIPDYQATAGLSCGSRMREGRLVRLLLSVTLSEKSRLPSPRPWAGPRPTRNHNHKREGLAGGMACKRIREEHPARNRGPTHRIKRPRQNCKAR